MKPLSVLRLHAEPIDWDDGPYGGGLWRPLSLQGCRLLQAQASWGFGWDHVSVSLLDQNRPPAWHEMEATRRFFFKPEETVVQLHPPLDQYVESRGPHKGVLHLWRKQDAEHALPPQEFV